MKKFCNKDEIIKIKKLIPLTTFFLLPSHIYTVPMILAIVSMPAPTSNKVCELTDTVIIPANTNAK
nr:hypothetical protein [uncultured Eubacterium sp.]